MISGSTRKLSSYSFRLRFETDRSNFACPSIRPALKIRDDGETREEEFASVIEPTPSPVYPSLFETLFRDRYSPEIAARDLTRSFITRTGVCHTVELSNDASLSLSLSRFFPFLSIIYYANRSTDR